MNLPENVQDILPLSAVQSGMLFHSIGDTKGSGVYVGIVSASIDGAIEPQRLKDAFRSALEQHSILKASFVFKGTKQPVQVIHAKVDLPWFSDDWSDLPQEAVALRKKQLVDAERRKGFDLSTPPLMRLHLIRLAADRHLFIWSVHHILSDGWSTTTFLDDVLRHYQKGETRHGTATSQPATFKDYLVWIRKRDTSNAQEYWSQHMSGFQGPPVIPVLTPETPASGLHQIRSLWWSPEQTEALNAAARKLRVTQSSFLAAIWALTLRRYSGNKDVTFGVATAGRPVELPGIAEAVGPFLTTLPLRQVINAEMIFSDVVTDVEATMRQRAAHEFVALRDVRAWAKLPPDQQLFEALFAHESIPDLAAGDGSLKFDEIETIQSSNYPLALIATPADGLRFEVYFDPNKFAQEVVARILEDFGVLLGNAVSDPHCKVPLLLRQRSFNPADEPTVPNHFPSVMSSFREAAALAPDAPAVSDAFDTLTYSELKDRIEQVAGTLKQSGVQPGDVVPVAVERSVQAVVAYFAVMATGAAYVPLDLEYPKDRLQLVLESAGARCVVTTVSAQDTLPSGAWKAICIDDCARDCLPQLFVDSQPNDLAYVIYTSGSLGLPKGVAISHGALAHSNGVRKDVYHQNPKCYLLLSSFSFDSSVAGLFWTLCSGGHLVIAPRRLENDPPALGAMLQKHSVSHTLCLPRLYYELLDAVEPEKLRSLTTVIVAGEPVETDLIRHHRSSLPECRLFNEYGPTEATVWSTVFDTAQHDAADPVPIGEEIPGMAVSVRDIDGYQLPDGVQGEIAISGPTLAEGYLNNAPETARKFPLLWESTGGLTRSYLSGDLGSVSPGGILFGGRVDHQIKLRGHRIETGEIEAVVRDIVGAVACCAVLSEQGARKDLVVCIEQQENPEQDAALRRAFEARLPQFARPRRVIWEPHLQRLPNGKLDRNAIGELARNAGVAEDEFSAPKTSTEIALAKIWSDVLGIEQISREANFFDLGGDSLSTISLFARCEQAGLPISPNVIFERPTLASLAEYVAAPTRNEEPDEVNGMVRKVHRAGRAPAVIVIHANMRLLSQLASKFGKDRPLGLKFTHLYKGMTLPLDTTISDLAKQADEDFSDLLRDRACVLVGYSAGCAVAQHMAQDIKKRGGRVDLLCLLDPPFVYRESPEVYYSLRNKAARLWNSGYVLTKHVILSTVYSLIGGHEKRRVRKVNTATALALNRFDPTPFDGNVLCISTADQEPSSVLFSKAETQTISGSHLDILNNKDTLLDVTSRLSNAIKAASKER